MSSTREDSLRKQSAAISVLVSTCLMAAKFHAYRVTSSVAILSDALESIINVISAVFCFIVLVAAARPADKNHPYGHGKLEPLASSYEGGAIFFAGILIIIEAIEGTVYKNELTNLDQGLVFIILAGLVNTWLGLYLKKKGKELQSPVLTSNGTHFLADSLTSLVLVLGIGITMWSGRTWVDNLLALFLGALLVREGVKIVKTSGLELLDTRKTPLLKKLIDVFEKNIFPGMIHIHHTRIMRSGRYHHIDLHLVVPEFWSIEKGHNEADKFQENVLNDYPYQGELHFHLDPCQRNYCQVCDLVDCPVRLEDFKSRERLTLADLTDENEPTKFKS